MLTFLMTFLGVLLIYLLLVAGSGSGDSLLPQLFSYEELIAAVILALLTAIIARLVMGKAENSKMLKNPLTWFVFLFYVFFYWMYYLVKANIDVAYRVITGRINPGIVKIRPNLRTNLGRTILANSITLTPGTLTVDVNEKTGDFIVHWINVSDLDDEKKKMEGVCSKFPDWARRIAE